MSTKPFFLTYVKRENDVLKKNWLSGHRLFGNRTAGTVMSLPSDRRLTLADNTRQKRRVWGQTQWTRSVCILVARVADRWRPVYLMNPGWAGV